MAKYVEAFRVTLNGYHLQDGAQSVNKKLGYFPVSKISEVSAKTRCFVDTEGHEFTATAVNFRDEVIYMEGSPEEVAERVWGDAT